MSNQRGATLNYQQEAELALAAAIIKEPERRQEFEKGKNDFFTAYDFYRNQGIPPEKIGSQVSGIDFNHPVRVGMVPPPSQVAQYQPPTTEGNFPQAAIGNYWAVPGQSPQALGISDYGKLRNPDKGWEAVPDAANVKKTAWQFEADTNKPGVPALFSTAAPVTDNWSRRTSWEPDGKVVLVRCAGGGQQIFAPEAKNLYDMTPGQKAIQTHGHSDRALDNDRQLKIAANKTRSDTPATSQHDTNKMETVKDIIAKYNAAANDDKKSTPKMGK